MYNIQFDRKSSKKMYLHCAKYITKDCYGTKSYIGVLIGEILQDEILINDCFPLFH